jgi:hypothetical protein
MMAYSLALGLSTLLPCARQPRAAACRRPAAAAPVLVARGSCPAASWLGGSAAYRRLRLLVAARASGDSPFDVSEAAVLANLDSLIDALLGAQTDAEFVAVVTANVLSFDVKFFLRLAARADVAPEAAKAALTMVSQRVMGMMDGIVAQTQKQMSASAEVLSKLVSAAADEGTGAFVLPLREDRLVSVKAVLAAEAVNEAVLSNAYAWMRKASDDGLDGMVTVIQRVLQLYAGKELSRPPQSAKTKADPAAEAVLQEVMATTEEAWDALLHAAAKDQAGGVPQLAVVTALQQRMEGVVLGLPNGSYAQRVQAEYLKELERRVSSAYA